MFTVSSRRYPRKKTINRNARAENGPQLEVKKGTRHREGERENERERGIKREIHLLLSDGNVSDNSKHEPNPVKIWF